MGATPNTDWIHMKTLGQFIEEAKKKTSKQGIVDPVAQIVSQPDSSNLSSSQDGPVFEESDDNLSKFMNSIQGALNKSQKNSTPNAGSDVFYFAYGHNTDEQTFKPLCPGAEYVGTGTLEGFVLEFEKYCNVRMQEGESVHGVVWKVPTNEFKNLDGYEALHKDYNRVPVEVDLDGKNVECITYIMDPQFESAQKNPQPSKSYLKTVATGYKQHGLPLSQIKDALNRTKGN